MLIFNQYEGEMKCIPSKKNHKENKMCFTRALKKEGTKVIQILSLTIYFDLN